MADTTPEVHQEPSNGIPATGGESNGQTSAPSTNQDHAAARLAEKNERLEQRLDRLEKDNEALRKQVVPESSQDDDKGEAPSEIESFIERSYKKEVLGEIADGLSQLPKTIQDQLKSNPYHLVDQRELDRIRRTALDKDDYYEQANKLAKESVGRLSQELQPASPGAGTPESATKTDPSPVAATTTPDSTGYTKGQLMAMAFTDPDKLEEITKSARR